MVQEHCGKLFFYLAKLFLKQLMLCEETVVLYARRIKARNRAVAWKTEFLLKKVFKCVFRVLICYFYTILLDSHLLCIDKHSFCLWHNSFLYVKFKCSHTLLRLIVDKKFLTKFIVSENMSAIRCLLFHLIAKNFANTSDESFLFWEKPMKTILLWQSFAIPSTTKNLTFSNSGETGENLPILFVFAIAFGNPE